jgi:predicted glycoside hydrolase/deacetylase ChbG (UPF0249 family)
MLSFLGKPTNLRQAAAGFPGNEFLIGVTDPPCVSDDAFLTRWLENTPGRVVELTCHPGFLDTTLLGRDATAEDGQMQRRVNELERLRRGEFRAACKRAGFVRLAPSLLRGVTAREPGHAA